MPSPCPLCGAILPPGESCEDRFNAMELQELDDPAYYAVHHLSVPCYMLQHNVYSQQGWLAVRDLLDQFVHQGLTPAQARRQFNSQSGSRRRTWSITRGAKLPGVEKITWSRTIADVRLDSEEAYIADVRAWASSILADSAELVNTAGQNRD